MARVKLDAHERRGIEFRILEHAEQREGRAPARPHVRASVLLGIGDREVEVGDVPALEGLPGDMPEVMLDELAGKVRGAVAEGAVTIAMYYDVFRLLELAPELRQAIARDRAGELGPVIGVLRARAGLSKVALARQIGHHRSTQAAWETGGPTGANIGTLSRAASALGYSAAAIVMVVDEISTRPASVA